MTAKQRDVYLRKTYGLTLLQYSKMVALQSGKCAICQLRPMPGRRLHVDHDHGTTKRVRGLLCWWCNKFVIGSSRTKPEYHERAVVYLRSSFDGRNL
jgi:hypothetical protein